MIERGKILRRGVLEIDAARQTLLAENYIREVGRVVARDLNGVADTIFVGNAETLPVTKRRDLPALLQVVAGNQALNVG